MYKISLIQLSRALDRREISSVELTEIYLDRIARMDGKYNSFITVTAELAARASQGGRSTAPGG